MILTLSSHLFFNHPAPSESGREVKVANIVDNYYHLFSVTIKTFFLFRGRTSAELSWIAWSVVEKFTSCDNIRAFHRETPRADV